MKEATFLISLATEEFIKRFSQAIQRVADKERRATVQQRDVGEFIRSCEIIFWGSLMVHSDCG
jgi:DNA polymerase epsilon subunit 4